MELSARDIIDAVAMLIGFSATIAVMKSDLAGLKKQVNGIGGKLSKVDERNHDNKIEIEKLKVMATQHKPRGDT